MNESDQWALDVQEREHEALQALMDISAAGFIEQADTLAHVSGLWAQWKAPVQIRDVSYIQFP